MSEAWQVRESQRQRLIEELMNEIFEEEEKSGQDNFVLRLMVVVARCLAYLAKKERRKGESLVVVLGAGGDPEMTDYFLNRIELRISAFARAPQERHVLQVEVLKKLIDVGCNNFYAALREVEFNNPRLIFRAPSAMVEVPIDERGNAKDV